jgi:DNA-binding PadR family transcriptional regulator
METPAERWTWMTFEIVASTPLAQSTVSQQLKVLRQAGLIQGEIEGPATCYCIDPAGVQWLKEQTAAWTLFSPICTCAKCQSHSPHSRTGAHPVARWTAN